jgi:hypothetical protein
MPARKRSSDLLAAWVRDRDHRRQLHRARIHIPVEVEVGARRIPARIVDLSSGGFRVEADASIGDERPIRLLRQGEALAVEIGWVEDNQLGGVFPNPGDLPDW